jgi:hypothetical protein
MKEAETTVWVDWSAMVGGKENEHKTADMGKDD